MEKLCSQESPHSTSSACRILPPRRLNARRSEDPAGTAPKGRRYSAERQKELVALQRSILDESARLTSPGGQLVYSTCSIEPEENDGNVAAFLKKHDDFELLKSRLLLPSHVNDGAFAALLFRRRKS